MQNRFFRLFFGIMLIGLVGFGMRIAFFNQTESKIMGSDIIRFWFDHAPQWFDKDPLFDADIRRRYLPLYRQAVEGELSSWENKPEDMLALIILLDQFPRNMFRDTPDAFASDALALSLTKKAIELGVDKKLSKTTYKQFLYMPLMHSEVLADQQLSVEVFSALNDPQALRYAEAHRDIIARFGRFPHRNKILGRPSTEEERVFLTQPNSGF